MTDPFATDDAATPLSPAALRGLIPTHVTLKSELDELEQINIAAANGWAFERKRSVLDESFLLGLHRRMFDKVWRWAGTYRTTEVNLGAAPHLIQTGLIQAIDNAHAWIKHKSYEPDELAVRFHHAAVVVHPFLNGNGRWARLAADLLVNSQGRKRFSWGDKSLQQPGSARTAYIKALKAADNHDLAQLVAFARS